ncbi:hypothetical protein [Stieleria varia]|uniref:Uncharacterized protein n=1 Tax=Stieleria varia TaxID=2528005 RepID=A0A5C5ZVX6_9BACT|nr:hypothetical protein [Stieleria varia]TWT91734.1 hypothetical protein Pla52n_64840 [Stieleria varia]
MTGIQFAPIRDERSLLYSPLAIRLLDTFTLQPPIGRTSLILQRKTAGGQWQDTDAIALRTADDVYSYPGLGRTANIDRSPDRCRVRIDTDYYEPYVPVDLEEFDVHPYNDQNPLETSQYAQRVRKIILQPNARYPYESHVPLMRGQLRHDFLDGPLIAHAAIEHQGIKVFSDNGGEFTLPIRFPAQDTFTVAPSQPNEIKVQNARGYFKALLSIDGEVVSLYRVIEIIWHSATSDVATLTLEPELGNDLPSGLSAGQAVSVRTFAVHIETPTVPEFVFDARAQSGVQKIQTIVIPSTP